MTWKGNDPALEFTTIEQVAAYIRSLSYNSGAHPISSSTTPQALH